MGDGRRISNYVGDLRSRRMKRVRGRRFPYSLCIHVFITSIKRSLSTEAWSIRMGRVALNVGF